VGDICDDSNGAHTDAPLGSAVTLTSDGVAGTYTSSATSTSYQPPNVGNYCFTATYSGSTVYNTSGDNTVTECFTVGHLTTTTVTTPSSGTITLGGSITDTAVVTGSVGGGDPTGDVNFFVCKLESGLCDGTINVGSAVPGNPKTLVSDGVAGTYTASATSGSYTPSAVGRYCFRAEYGGDSDYTGSSDSRANECFTVTDTSSASSQQKWLPNDSATAASANGAPLNGTLSIQLYEGGTCTGTAVSGQLYSKTLTNATTLAARTLATSNTTYEVSVSKSVSWLVTFTSTDTYVTGSTHCESTALTINN
jgi:hypothetical protein